MQIITIPVAAIVQNLDGVCTLNSAQIPMTESRQTPIPIVANFRNFPGQIITSSMTVNDLIGKVSNPVQPDPPDTGV
jgi:hypothetical protein